VLVHSRVALVESQRKKVGEEERRGCWRQGRGGREEGSVGATAETGQLTRRLLLRCAPADPRG